MKNLYIKNGNVFIDGNFQKANLTIREGRITEIDTTEIDTKEIDTAEIDATEIDTKEINADQTFVYDAKGQSIVPGFIDLHTHGAVNVDVNSATAQDLEKISQFFATQGTTSWLASVLTDTKEQTLWCIDQYNAHKEMENSGAELMGIHLEGPFLAAEYKGAMPEHLLKKQPDMKLLEEYQKAANGEIRSITISPEIEGIIDCIGQMKDLGMVVGIGHSGADYDTSMESIENGATSATHTFNAMKLMHQHFPAIAGAVLESNVYCEAICDGRHLHPAIVRLLIKTKGLDKVVAVTDSIMATGLPDGNYKLGVNDIVVVEGDAKLANGGTRAGSTLTTKTALKNLLSFTSRPLEEVLPLLTENPAKLMGIFHEKGSIAPGKYADLVILNNENDVVDTFVKGKLIIK